MYEILIDKIDAIKCNLDEINKHTKTLDTDKKNIYLEKLLQVTTTIHNLEATTNDLYDEYILSLPESRLTCEEKNKQKNIIINKKIQEIFLPYMLYLQVILHNKS